MGEKMQAAGSEADAEQGGGLPGTTGAGDGNGGTYPNPHDGDAPTDGIMGHGGQSDIAYHSTGQLGHEQVAGEENDNSATEAG